MIAEWQMPNENKEGMVLAAGAGPQGKSDTEGEGSE